MPAPHRTPARPSGPRRALVVGGGVGGLAAAIAIRSAGWEVEVLERGTVRAAPGAGLALWPNGVRALRALGMGDAIAPIAARVPEMAVRRPDGRVLGRFDGAAVERRWGAPLLAVHRADLLAAELDHLGADRVRQCTEVELVEEGGVRLTDGTRARGRPRRRRRRPALRDPQRAAVRRRRRARRASSPSAGSRPPTGRCPAASGGARARSRACSR